MISKIISWFRGNATNPKSGKKAVCKVTNHFAKFADKTIVPRKDLKDLRKL